MSDVFNNGNNVSYHGFDGESGGISPDLINSNDATLVGGASIDTVIKVQGDGSLLLNGTDGFARLANESNYDVDRNDAWGGSFGLYSPAAASGEDYIFSKFDSVGILALLNATTGQIRLRILGSGGNLWVYSDTGAVPDDTQVLWNFSVDGSRTAAGVKMYFDGVRRNTNIIQDTLPDSSILNSKQMTYGIFSNEVAAPYKGNLDACFFRHGSVITDGGVAVDVTATEEVAELYGGGAWAAPSVGVGSLVNNGLINGGLANGGLVS